jgi:hypothetical protein
MSFEWFCCFCCDISKKVIAQFKMSVEAGFISIDDDSFSLSKDERLVFFRIPKEVGYFSVHIITFLFILFPDERQFIE